MIVKPDLKREPPPDYMREDIDDEPELEVQDKGMGKGKAKAVESEDNDDERGAPARAKEKNRDKTFTRLDYDAILDDLVKDLATVPQSTKEKTQDKGKVKAVETKDNDDERDRPVLAKGENRDKKYGRVFIPLSKPSAARTASTKEETQEKAKAKAVESGDVVASFPKSDKTQKSEDKTASSSKSDETLIHAPSVDVKQQTVDDAEDETTETKDA
jgi:hypothetical protein